MLQDRHLQDAVVVTRTTFVGHHLARQTATFPHPRMDQTEDEGQDRHFPTGAETDHSAGLDLQNRVVAETVRLLANDAHAHHHHVAALEMTVDLVRHHQGVEHIGRTGLTLLL